MNVIPLSAYDLSLAALLVGVLALVSVRMRLNLATQLVIAALRTTIQLLLIGLILKFLFERAHPAHLVLMAGVMLAVAGREIMHRQKRRFTGWWGYGVGSISMFISSFIITILALIVIIDTDPWYQPRYAIPLLGMMLGNTMNGMALGLDRLIQTTWDQREVVEARLMIGFGTFAAVSLGARRLFDKRHRLRLDRLRK